MLTSRTALGIERNIAMDGVWVLCILGPVTLSRNISGLAHQCLSDHG
jgi:hypothetical protein